MVKKIKKNQKGFLTLEPDFSVPGEVTFFRILKVKGVFLNVGDEWQFKTVKRFPHPEGKVLIGLY